jgi:hypothetical protein
MLSVCTPFLLSNQQNNCHEIWCKYSVIHSHPNVIHYSGLQSVGTEWQMIELTG